MAGAHMAAHMAALRPGSAAGLGVPGAEAGRLGMAQAGYTEASDAKPRRRVLGHFLACSRCSKSKIKCDGARPCSRCMQRGLADECENQGGVPPGSKPRRRDQSKYAQACVQCSRRKVRCDGGWPCGRCVQRGLSDVCRSRQATSDGGVALVGGGGEGEWAPHSIGETKTQNEWLGGLKLRANGLGINGLSSAGAAIPQQSAVVGLLSQGSATFARDASAAAGWGGMESGAGVAGGGLRLLSQPLPQQHLGTGDNAGRTSALPLLRGENHQPLSQTLLGMDSGVLPATLSPLRMGSLEPAVQPMQSPFGTTQAPLARTPGSDRNLGLFSSGNSTSNLGLVSLGSSSSNLGLVSLGSSTSSLGSVSDPFLNSLKVRCSTWGAHVPADAPPTLGIPNLYSLGSSSSLFSASFSSLFSAADSVPNLGLCSLGNSGSSLEGGGMGGVGAKAVCTRQEVGALPVPIHEPSFDRGSHSEPSQLSTWATLVGKKALVGCASPDQSRVAEQCSRRCAAMSDLYSDSGKDVADASGAAASASDSGPLIGEVDVTLPVERRCRLSLATPCRDVEVGCALVAAG